MAQTIVHNSVQGNGLYQWAKRPSGSLVAFDANTLYDFFIDDVGGHVECHKSIDGGETWAEVAEVTTDGVAISFGIYYARWTNASFSPVVHVLAHVDSSPRGVIYSSITLGTDVVSGEQVLKTWGPEPNGGHTSITVDSEGGLHAFAGGPALGFDAYHFYSSDNGVNWTDTRSMSFTPGLAIRDLISAWPDFSGDAGDVLLVHGDFDAGGDLYLHRYDHSGDSWSDVEIDSSFSYGETSAISAPVGFAWRRSDGVLWVFGVHANDVSPATCKVWHIEGATVTAMTDLVEETYLRTAAGFMLSDGRLVGVYSYDPTDTGPVSGLVQGVYYKISEDDGDTWSEEVQYSEFSTNRVNAILTDPFPAVDVGFIVYHLRDDGADYIEAPILELDADPPEEIIYRLMLATVEAPDTPSVNITPESVRAR